MIKFEGLVHDVLLEEIKNKKLFNNLMARWTNEDPNVTPERGEELITKFQQIQNGLRPDRPQVVSFLSRFDGKHGYEIFDPINIKDISKYSLKQLTSLISEFSEDTDTLPQGDVFAGKDYKPTPERIEVSKGMWFSPDDAIINEDGFRVYNIRDQQMSMKFGYWLQVVANDLDNQSPWCVTWRPPQTNMWASYRNQGRSFYFVIDESKGPNDSHYLGALQRDTEVTTGYRITSAKNDGDTVYTWDQVLRIYPQLSKYKELIKVKDYSQTELELNDAAGQISEQPGSRYEFKRMDRGLKRAYINSFGQLKEPDSWRSMDDGLRNLYIQTTRAQDIKDKYSNFAFFSEIKKVGNELTQLNNRLIALGHKDGTGFILDTLMSNEFKVARTSVDNPNIKLYESKINKKFGLFNSKKGEWVTLGGITYEPLYKEINNDIYSDSEGDTYFVEIFGKSTEENNESFYSIYLVGDSNTDVSSHFLSHGNWEKLQAEIDTPKPDEHTDIKENK